MGIRVQAISLGVCIPLMLTGCSSFAQGFADGHAGTNLPSTTRAEKQTCQDLADQAVEISKDQDTTLLKVRKLKVKADHSSDYKKPTGDKESLVLSCTGTGVWSSGATTPVLLQYTVDSDGQGFFSYKEL